MRVNSNGSIVDSESTVSMMFLHIPDVVVIRIGDQVAGIRYQEFLEMANEIIKKKEDLDER